MDRRQFLTLSAGLSALASNPVAAALSLDEVQSGMKLNRQGRVVGEGTDFLKIEKTIYMDYLHRINTTGIKRNNGYRREVEDRNSRAALDNIYLPLTRFSTRENLDWKIVLLDNPEIDAFTPGGGLTCVSHGLIKHCKTEDEFVCVIAHELGHIEHKHAIRRLMSIDILEQYGLASKFKAKELDDANARKRRGIDISVSKMMEISLEIFYRNFTRMWEHQADAYILKIFVENGFDLKLASKFFKILGKKYGYEARGTCLYNTHPETLERVNRIEAIANTLTNTRRSRGDSDEFRYLKDRIGHIDVKL